MPKIGNSLSDRLAEYIELLRVLGGCFDRGDEVVALSIATAIRVLVHDTAASTSLLSHLGKKAGTRFLSTALPRAGEAVHLGLVRRINVGVHDGAGGEAKYWALSDERYFPTPITPLLRLEFNPWWGECVFATKTSELTRKELVLAVANKDGGAHFDAEVDERYDVFRKSWSGGSSLFGLHSGRSRGYDNIPTYPAVRQIAYELIRSVA